MKFLKLFFLLFILNSLSAQSFDNEYFENRIKQLADSLSAEKQIMKVADNGQELSYGIVNDSIVQIRKSAFEKIESVVFEYANNSGTFYSFPADLPSVKVVYPRDSSFRFITWVGQFSKNEFQYGGVLQFKTAKKPILLEAAIIEEDFELNTFDAKNWPSAFYYNIYDFKKSGDTYYLLFSYDGYKQYSHRKWIDVLHFDDNGNPIFGAQVFDFESENKSKIKRFVLEYAAEINIKLNYNEEEKLIMYDHLIPMKSRYADEEVFVPDGSYEGLNLKKGKWKHIDKIKTLILDEAPRDTPILDTRKGKNIIGQ